MFLGMLMKLKILNYNILHGFYPYDLSISKLLDTKRLKAVQEIIKIENPDIVVLTEACFAQNNIFNIKMDYPRLFGFKYHFHANVIHASIINEWGSSLLSKFPIKEADNYNKTKLIKGFNTFQDNAKEKINDFMKFSVIKEILNVCLKDTFKVCNKKFDFTIPTDYLSKNKDSG